MRGAGEGHQPWDFVPNSTMTNTAVVQMVKAVDGDQITLKYKGGKKKIIVPANTIVPFVPGDKSELKPGEKIFIAAARKKDDGSLKPAPSRPAATAFPRRCEADTVPVREAAIPHSFPPRPSRTHGVFPVEGPLRIIVAPPAIQHCRTAAPAFTSSLHPNEQVRLALRAA